MKTNKSKLVQISVQGEIDHPIGGYIRVNHAGEPVVIPAVGGIVYNVKVGDDVFGIVGDHIEPGVSLKNKDKSASDALMTFSCIGNKAKVFSGKAEGAIGYVTGKHGGIEHVIIYFENEDLHKMAMGDQIVIEACGQGFALSDYPDIKVMSIDPEMFGKIDIEEKNGKIIVPVVAKIPAYLMGSGVGSGNSYSGDYDLMTADENKIKQLGLDKLKFGDLVLLEDCDNTNGRGYLENSVTIGVIIHGDCISHGHGPGIATIISSKKTIIEAKMDKSANITKYYEMMNK